MLEHHKFKELIDVASRATNGVKIPGRKATRAEILCLFKDHLVQLRAEFGVRVSFCILTCFLLVPHMYRVQRSRAM